MGRPHRDDLPDGVSLDEVFAEIGRTLLYAQEFERVVRGVTTVFQALETHGGGPLNFTGLSKLPIGPILEKGRQWIEFDSKGKEIIEEARRRRNALCHAWFEDHAQELTNPAERHALVLGLKEDARWFQSAADLFKACGEALIQMMESDVVE